MPKREINYDSLPDEAAKRDQAIKDIIAWIGPKKFKEVSSMVRNSEPPVTFGQFEVMCGIGGLEGYPVRVWAEDCGIEVPIPKPKDDSRTEES